MRVCPRVARSVTVWMVLGLGLAASCFTASQVALLDTGPALVPGEVRSTATGLLDLTHPIANARFRPRI
jgi:hypothetical protein